MAAGWIDAQLSPGLATWLRAVLSVDAYAVGDPCLRDAEDHVIFDRARTDFAIVVTKDRDCEEMVIRRGPPPQIVWLTCGNTSNADLHGILSEAWPRASAVVIGGQFVGGDRQDRVLTPFRHVATVLPIR